MPHPPPDIPTRPEGRGLAEVIQTGAAVIIATPTAIALGSQIKDKLSGGKEE